MRGLFEVEGLVVGNLQGAGHDSGPELWITADHGWCCKGFVNQCQTILNVLKGGPVQKKVLYVSNAGAIAQKGLSICQTLGHVKETSVTGKALQTALKLIYPPRCTICGGMVDSDFGLCGPCWRDTPIISGLCCDTCGVPLPGEDDGRPEYCDACLTIARPWTRGRAALLYKDNGRKLVLSLKHGDRHDIVRLAANWMSQAARPLLRQDTLVAPVPLHWTRMLKRRFNQSSLLAQALARQTGSLVCPDLLIRLRATRSLDGLGQKDRFDTLDQAIGVKPGRRHRIVGRNVLLVDDVMTSGATLSACAQACFSAGAGDVCVLTLARVAKDA